MTPPFPSQLKCIIATPENSISSEILSYASLRDENSSSQKEKHNHSLLCSLFLNYFNIIKYRVIIWISLIVLQISFYNRFVQIKIQTRCRLCFWLISLKAPVVFNNLPFLSFLFLPFICWRCWDDFSVEFPTI